MKLVIAQIIGFVSMIFAIIAFQNNSKKRILAFQGLSAGIFAIHFVLLGAYTGAGMNAIEMIRNLVFRKTERFKWKMVFVIVFSLLFVMVGVLTWQNPWSLLPIFAQILATAAVSFKKPKHIRLFFAPIFSLWLIYNGVSLSIAGVLTEIFDMGSLAIAIWRIDIKRGKNNEQGTNS